MPIICRLFALTPTEVEGLALKPERLINTIQTSDHDSDVYRYWHGIDYLLQAYQGDDAPIGLLQMGQPLPAVADNVPLPRLVKPDEVARFNAFIGAIEPEDDLIPLYDAAAMDAASVYPMTWVEWEEWFDPLGYSLEHFSWLQDFVAELADDGEGMLIYFVFEQDQTDD